MKSPRVRAIFTIAAGLALAWSARSEPAQVVCAQDDRINIEFFARGLTHPFGLAWLPGGEALVTERGGRLLIVSEPARPPRVIRGLPRLVNLFDVAVDPQYQTNRFIYVAYTARYADGVALEVVRAVFGGDGLEAVQVIFKALPLLRMPAFSGGRLLFLRDGTLLISVGDAPEELSRAQDLGATLGKIVRIRADGGIPVDNPFVAVDGARRELYSVGHRNVQGLALDIASGNVWASEHGSTGQDEVNTIAAGHNYGWPVMRGAETRQTFTPPAFLWPEGIAPSGMAFYSGDAIPQWRGSLFVAALKGQALLRLRVTARGIESQESLLGELGERIRDVRSGPDGYLYVLIDSLAGAVLRLGPLVEGDPLCRNR